ncbi:hypothetical protein GOZ94_02635 [Agrobacterium vitis]|uniref:hypothetical protein n=1 Tax=Agrobacterium vitis TaxID=373 RepID=UPI0012E9456C|nr:hypothetical protein [Agrobacterium vitis]MVA17845.1 hypothetical protein [Agrobacterium vitis]
MLAEEEAREAVRQFLAQRHHAPLRESLTTAERQVIEDRDAWVISGVSEDSPADEDWMYFLIQPPLYFVDAATGSVFGYQAGSSRTIFK